MRIAADASGCRIRASTSIVARRTSRMQVAEPFGDRARSRVSGKRASAVDGAVAPLRARRSDATSAAIGAAGLARHGARRRRRALRPPRATTESSASAPAVQAERLDRLGVPHARRPVTAASRRDRIRRAQRRRRAPATARGSSQPAERAQAPRRPDPPAAARRRTAAACRPPAGAVDRADRLERRDADVHRRIATRPAPPAAAAPTPRAARRAIARRSSGPSASASESPPAADRGPRSIDVRQACAAAQRTRAEASPNAHARAARPARGSSRNGRCSTAARRTLFVRIRGIARSAYRRTRR